MLRLEIGGECRRLFPTIPIYLSAQVMPNPDRLLGTLERAITTVRATPGRRGHLVHLQNVEEVLVCGDVHGHLENFRSLLQIADLARHPQRHFVLQEVVHGPYRYLTGGDKSHQILDLTAALKCQFPQQVHFLPGNHELAQWTGRMIGKEDWDLTELFDQGVEEAYGDHAPEILKAYHRYFAVLPFALRTPNRVFLSHSLPKPSRLETFDPEVLAQEELPASELEPGGSVFALVWGRDCSEENAQAFLEKVDADWLISGHVPCEGGYEFPNDRQVILDTQDYPAAYCLFPTDHELTTEELRSCVHLL